MDFKSFQVHVFQPYSNLTISSINGGLEFITRQNDKNEIKAFSKNHLLTFVISYFKNLFFYIHIRLLSTSQSVIKKLSCTQRLWSSLFSLYIVMNSKPLFIEEIVGIEYGWNLRAWKLLKFVIKCLDSWMSYWSKFLLTNLKSFVKCRRSELL